MGFNPPVPQQDSNWEIRAAVLLSLLLQVLLVFLGPTRKRSSHPFPRFTVWSCYLLADWVADLTLGLLLSNMGNIGGSSPSQSSSSSAGNDDSGSPMIFAFWTPFLLLHLGGPDTITAYSVEDNELWNRHLVGLLFELFSAAVIILCSLHGNPMIPATFLILLVGVIKYGERTYSLYASSALRDSMVGPPDAGPNYAKLMSELDARTNAGLVVDVAVASPENRPAMTTRELHDAGILAAKSVEAKAYDLFLNFRPLFIDIILSSKQRRLGQAFFLRRPPDLTPGEAFEVIEVELNFVYDMVYTKAPVAHTRAGWALRCVCSGCLAAALAIFLLLDKRRHNISRVDTGITYALLLGGLALDAAALLMVLFSNLVTVYLEDSQRLKWLVRLTRAAKQLRRTRRWSGKASQLNLIGYCLGRPEHNRWWLMKVADKVGLEEIVDDYVFIKRVPLVKEETSSLLDFIFNGLQVAAQELQEKKQDIVMEFCNRRGMGVLGRLGNDIREALQNDDDKFDLIWESVEKRDFDQSLLLWHIATDLCVSCRGTKRAAAAHIGETLSEYMLYLLVKQPDMLAATASIGLRPYRDTCAEVRRFFSSIASMGAASTSRNDDEGAREMLLRVNTSEKPSAVKGYRSKSVLFDAVILAKALMALNNDELMWEVVSGVWVEMLTFAASKCRGSTHVRKLNHGGELITLLWLLMQHMGLSDMYEIQEGDPSVKLTVRD